VNYAIRVVLGASAFILSLVAGLLTTALFGAAIPIWAMAAIIGRGDLLSAPGHGAGAALPLMFLTVPVAAVFSVVLVGWLTPALYKRFSERLKKGKSVVAGGV
jgi:hypothetical protein